MGFLPVKMSTTLLIAITVMTLIVTTKGQQLSQSGCICTQHGQGDGKNNGTPIVHTKDNKDIFEVFITFPEDLVLKFFEQKKLTEIVEAFKNYIKIKNEQTKEALKKILYQFYSIHKQVDQDIDNLKQFLEQNGQGHGKNNGTPIVHTKDNKDIFEVFITFPEDLVLKFFEQKKLTEIVEAFKNYIKTKNEHTKETLKKCLYKYYSIHNVVDHHIEEFNNFFNSSIQGFFELFDSYNYEIISGFFEQRQWTDILEAYKHFKRSKTEESKNIFKKHLYRYCSVNKLKYRDIEHLKTHLSKQSRL